MIFLFLVYFELPVKTGSEKKFLRLGGSTYAAERIC